MPSRGGVLSGTVFAVGMLVFLGSKVVNVHWNVSHSLPFRAFVRFPLKDSTPLARGDYVRFSHPKRPRGMVKQIQGVAGDRIVLENGTLYIMHPVGPVHPRDSKGRPLTPIKARTIPPGVVFVAGSHSGSLDSRYESFGLISRPQCQRVMPW